MPVRTCIGCRKKTEQGEMQRIARGADGVVGLWRGFGRSAYLHRDPACREAGLGKGRIERALRVAVSAADRERIREELDAN